MRPHGFILLGTLGLSLGLVSCGASKQNGCTALINVVNSGLSELENGKQQAKNDPSQSTELRLMADALEKAGAAAAQLELTVPELKAISLRYQAMARDLSKHARDVADAAEKKDNDKLQKARGLLNETLKLEDPIVDDLNKFCAE
ncbi:MAG: hypothetical protein JNK04_26170 [Myxococcales bacterium]|nr:hypothetical protein [Myxococcales bacterium]